MKKFVRSAGLILLFPVVVFEYFVLFWFWGGAGAFNFFATPVAFVLYMAGFVFAAGKASLGKSLKVFALVFVPLLTIITVCAAARLCGVETTIM